MVLSKFFYSSVSIAFMFLNANAHAEIQIIRKAEASQTFTMGQSSYKVESENNNNNAKTLLTNKTQTELMNSVTSNSVNAPDYATSVSSQNEKTFNSAVPLLTNNIRLKNPPAYMACFYSSSRKYGVPVDLLLAIAQTESSFNPQIKGTLGKGADHGLMQINDWWIPRLRNKFNITLADIYDPCTNIEIASWILAHNFVQFGYSWRAVGAYNAVSEHKRVIYIRKVSNNLKKLHAGLL